ncbi:hypothetical protein [Ferruginibacter profundus]
MKKKFLLSLLLYLIFFCTAAQSRFRQTLSNRFTIDFPVKPQFKDTLGKDVYYSIGDSACYTAIVADDEETGDMLHSEKDLYEYYEGIIEGILKAEKSKLVTKSNIQWNGVKGMEIECSLPVKTNIYDLKFKRFFFFNRKLIVLDYSTFAQYRNVTEQDKANFFSSLQLVQKNTAVSQYSANVKSGTHSTAYALGKITGVLVMLLILGFIIYRVVKR